MGAFHIEISAEGVHGCDRLAQEGDTLHRACGRMGCPDCETRDFVQRLQAQGVLVRRALFTHLPTSTHDTVVDDVVKRRRVRGQFHGAKEQA